MGLSASDAWENYIRYKNDKWAFILECCYTKDEVNKEAPIKLMPDKEYLRLYVKLWSKYPLMAVPKTRRMTLSWVTICCYVHETIFNKVQNNAFVSKKEDDANDLVLRAKFILDHIPADRIPRELIPKYDYKFNSLTFPEIDSKIRGFPQGADQLRQFTFSGIFGDESAFWEQAEEFYSATFPTIDGGGRMTMVSSPAPGFFKKICYDCIDKPGDVIVADHAPNYTVPMQGTRLWVNKKNRFLVLELHYTADPTKRDPSYKESIKNSMPLMKYLREYELEWDTFSGQAVYPEFNAQVHVIHEKPKPSFGLPMLIAFDFGLTPAAVIAQYEGRTLTIFKELTETNMGAERFLPIVIAYVRLHFPEFGNLKTNWRCFVDPSGFKRVDTDERKTTDIVAKHGFNPMPGPMLWEPRRTAVAELLTTLDKGLPCLQIYAKDCPITYTGFKGGYHYPEKDVEIAPSKLRPVKNAASHPHDCVQYLASGVKNLRHDNELKIPIPSYHRDVNNGRRV